MHAGRYLLRLNDLKFKRSYTLFAERLARKYEVDGGRYWRFFYQGKRKDFYDLPDEKQILVKDNFIPIDRIKDEIAVLMKKHSEDRHTIVSFLLSTMLNNIGKKKNGYKLFHPNHCGKAMLLIDLTMYIYAYCPSFESTRKVISILSYINDELDFKTNEIVRKN